MQVGIKKVNVKIYYCITNWLAELICNLAPLAGQSCNANSNSTVTRHYYHAPLRECRSFIYYGCNGNANNFETMDECHSFCSIPQVQQQTSTEATTISAGSSATATTQIIPEIETTTPIFPVQTTTLFGSFPDYKCPVFGQMLHSDPAYRLCSPASVYPCPDGYTCQKAQKTNAQTDEVFVCCGPPNGPARSKLCMATVF